MWIMLIKKLPVKPSPPKLSIFWSVPWPAEGEIGVHAGLCQICGQKPKKGRYKNATATCDCGTPTLVTPDDNDIRDPTGFGREPNWVGARKIRYQGKDIRVFPHEFSKLKSENMRLYILGDDESDGDTRSHELVPEGVAEQEMVKAILDGETRPIYDQALGDGCTTAQAMAVAMGIDITLPDAEFPPLGWYRCRPEYASAYCWDWEMKEE